MLNKKMQKKKILMTLKSYLKKNEENSGRGSRSGKGKMKKKVGKKMRERKYNDATLEKEASLFIFYRLEAFEISVVPEGERERGRSE